MTFVFVLIQIIIVGSFLRLYSAGRPVDINDTKQADIIVEDSYLTSTRKEQWLVIIADSEKYLFESHSLFDSYPLGQLNESISKGDKISLRYYEGYAFFGRYNFIVEAQNETEIFRTIEEYNRSKQGVPIFAVILFIIIEIVCAFIVFVYFWINRNIVKGLFGKIKKRRKYV